MSAITVTTRDESGPSLGRLRRLATGLAVAAAGLTVGVLLLAALGDSTFTIGPNLLTVGFLGNVVLFPLVGALIVQRRPLQRVAWLMIAIGIGLGIGLFLYGWGVVGSPPGRTLPWAIEALMVSELFFVPSVATGAALLLLLFPTDRLLSPRWRLVAVLSLAGAALYEIGTLFHAGELNQDAVVGIQNPIAAPAELAPLVGVLAAAGNTMVTAAVLLAAGSLVIRYRRSGPVEAAQIRWIAFVAALASLTFALAAIRLNQVSDFAFEVGLVMLACLPIAIGFAITRYRLYDIDRLINRALVYGSLTAILAGVFTAAVGLGQRLFVATTGQSSDAALVLTTLFVATLYAPLRKRLEAIVDRRFKYDEHRFGAYRDEVNRVLSVVEPERSARRLVEEAVRELRATGGAIVDGSDRPVATAGTWPVPPVVRLPIPGGSRRVGTLLVGPRVDGRPHDPRSIAELEDVAALVAAAVRLGPPAEPD